MKQIPLNKGLFAIVDDQDYEELSRYTWTAYLDKKTNTYYACRVHNKVHIRMYRHIMNPPKEMVVDHINGNGLDNLRENLRIASKSCNSKNSILRKSNSSGIMGVTYMKKINKWAVRISTDTGRLYLGVFSNIFDAAACRKSAEIEHGYHTNHGRIKEEVNVPRKINERRKTIRNTSGYVGVSLNKDTGTWDARIRLGGKQHYLGLFKNIEDAVSARRKAESNYYLSLQSQTCEETHRKSVSQQSPSL